MPAVNLGKSREQLQIEQELRELFKDEKKNQKTRFVSLQDLTAYIGKDRRAVRKLMDEIPAYKLDGKSISYRIDQAAAVIASVIQ